jgi:ribonuclease J
MTEPFNDEMEIDFRRVENWLKHFGLYPMHMMHVSGHGSGEEILGMIREIAPQKLYPIHTEHIEVFDILRDDGIEVVYPEIRF